MSGNLIGNLYVFFAWSGQSEISESLQHDIAIITGTISLVGSFIFLFLRPLPEDLAVSTTGSQLEITKDYFKAAGTVIRDWRIQYMIPLAIMGGIQTAFFATVYPTCIGTSKGIV